MTIYDILKYGPVVFADSKAGVLISIEGQYLHWWGEVNPYSYVSQYAQEIHSNGSSLAITEAEILAKRWFEEFSNDS